jgi:hypothetical protein
VSETTMRFMMALSSRGREVPTGGRPIAVADRLCPGCDLLELPGWRGLFCALLLDSSRVLPACDELPAVVVEGCVRCDEVRGGAMGPLPLVVGVLFMAGEFCVEGGSGCARGVFSVELCDAAGEW